MILIFNAGSSSLKGKLYDVVDGRLSIISEKSIASIQGEKGFGHAKATQNILNHFKDNLPDIRFVGHRIVMGGMGAVDGEVANKESIQRIKDNSIFAPLHNPAALAVINYCLKKLPKSKNCLFYDTTFYQELPREEFTYPIDRKIAEKYHIRKIGFHGLSHQYAFNVSGASKYQNVISIHLGAGCSVTAIRDSKPIATSMGLTPQGGVMMRSRCGDIDPGLILFIVEKIGIQKAKRLIEKESGLSAFISGGEMLDALFIAGEKVECQGYHYTKEITKDQIERAKLAIEIYCQKIRDYIGAYALRMNGIDAIIFTGKIGSGSSVIRNQVLSGLDIFKIKEVYSVEPDEETAIAKMLYNIIINK